MGTFDFIADERLRESLEKDHVEVSIANQGEAWKAVHVLVGSIVEALLVDYLQGIDYGTKSGIDPLKMDLNDLIKACEKQGALSAKAVQLCSAIRGYRNLIHPGRVLRLSEKIDKNGATVAVAVMQMVTEEIALKRKEQHGYTAEQIVAKIERDPSAMGILAHLVVDMRPHEQERLLLKVIPDRFFEIEENWEGDYNIDTSDEEKQTNLSRCFRTTFEMVPVEVRQKAAKKFVQVLRQEGEHKVLSYETAFFQAADLQYLPPTDATLAKQHLLARLTKSPSALVLKTSKGISKYLIKDDIGSVVDALVHVAAHAKPRDAVEDAREMIVNLWSELDGGLDTMVLSRLDDWIRHFTLQGQESKAQIVVEIKSECDIPF
jgi:hypothetical protein